MMFHALILSSLLLVQPPDTLPPASISSIKDPIITGSQAPGRTRLYLKDMERNHIESVKDFSTLVPGLHIPDYGSSMTSTIYLRGFGSRMENPVMGLYIDDIPVLDKNVYDFSFLDIRSAEVLRGPQGTLYGRNTMMGVMSLETLSADVFQGVRASMGTGTGGRINARASVYTGDWSVAFAGSHQKGFYTNKFTGLLCDPSTAASFRVRFTKALTGRISLDNIFSASWTDQGGYPYRRFVDGELLPVSYNDPSGYRRLYLSEGLRLSLNADKIHVKSVTSIQALLDRMQMDQDFTSASMFTLEQRQKEWAFTQEFTLSPATQSSLWRHRSGVFLFLKPNRMQAPVLFKEDGIRTLILANANAHMPEYLGTLRFDETSFPIDSRFQILAFNAAAYHESAYHNGNWQFVLGLRADWEADRIRYDSDANVHFRLDPVMEESYPCTILYEGTEHSHSFQLLPKVALLRDFSWSDGSARVQLLFSEGYRAGGFNTQIFSDILQKLMMTRLMELCGVHLPGDEDSLGAENTVYKPEFSDNFELGGMLDLHPGSMRLTLSTVIYYVLGRNQQITVFPQGMSTGRMMKNAGLSRSTGVELSLSLQKGAFRCDAAWGFSDARFLRYKDGNNDYSGKRIPYVPAHTLSVRASYTLGGWSVLAGLDGKGDICWDETNALRTPFYLTPSAMIAYETGHLRFYLRGENLLGKEQPVFYFKSVGNSFFQLSRPATISLGIDYQFTK